MATVKLLVLDESKGAHRVVEYGDVVVDASGTPIDFFQDIAEVLEIGTDAGEYPITNLGAVTLSTGNLTVSDGDLIVSNGVLTVTGNATVYGAFTVSGDLATFDSGIKLTAGGVELTGTGDIDISNGVLNVSDLGTFGGGIEVTSGDIVISGSGNVDIQSGTLDVQGLTTLSGGLTVDDGDVDIQNGTLDVDGLTTLNTVLIYNGSADAYVEFQNGAATWSVGIDYSDSNRFKIHPASALADTSLVSMTSTNVTIDPNNAGGGAVVITNSADGTTYLEVSTTSATADAWIRLSAGSAWSVGVDNSNSDAFTISNTFNLGTTANNLFVLGTGGLNLNNVFGFTMTAAVGTVFGAIVHNTHATGMTELKLDNDGTGACQVRYDRGGAFWSTGMYIAGDDRFKIHNAVATVATSLFEIDTSGNVYVNAGNIEMSSGKWIGDSSTTARVLFDSGPRLYLYGDSTYPFLSMDVSTGILWSQAKTGLASYQLDNVNGTTGSVSLYLGTNGSGDSYLVINAGSLWAVGVDNSDSDNFKIAQAAILGTALTDHVIITTAGVMSVPNGQIQAHAGNSNAPGLSFINTTTVGIDSWGNNLQLVANGSGRLIVANDGSTVTIASANLLLGSVKSGSTQALAGAAANEVWKTSGHVSLADNVLMHGV